MEASDESDEHTLACDMFELHRPEAPTVVQKEARAAALVGQAARARSWIRMLGLIQRRQANQAPPIPTSGDPPPGDIPSVDEDVLDAGGSQERLSDSGSSASFCAMRGPHGVMPR